MKFDDHQWDEWRSDPLTQRFFDMLVEIAERDFGVAAKVEVEENYPELFASPARQANYSALRGRIEGVMQARDCLKMTLSDLTKTDENDEKDRPEDV